MLAVFTLGANDFQIKNMLEIARNKFGGSQTYTEEKRLLNDAKTKKFESILIFDREALSQEATQNLNDLKIDILCFKENASLKAALEKRKEFEAEQKKRNENSKKHISEIEKMIN